MQKIIFIYFIVLLFSCSEISEQNDIYNYVPKESRLTLELVRKSFSVLSYEQGYVLAIDLSELTKEADNYNPHLLFYDNKGVLKSACYFSAETFYSFEKNKLIAYLNEYRYQRKHIYQNDLPVYFNLIYKKYKSDRLPSTINLRGGVLKKLSYNNFTKNVLIIYSRKHDTKEFKIVTPLYKIVYDYNKKQIGVNGVKNEIDKTIQVFELTNTTILDDFFIKVFPPLALVCN